MSLAFHEGITTKLEPATIQELRDTAYRVFADQLPSGSMPDEYTEDADPTSPYVGTPYITGFGYALRLLDEGIATPEVTNATLRLEHCLGVCGVSSTVAATCPGLQGSAIPRCQR